MMKLTKEDYDIADEVTEELTKLFSEPTMMEMFLDVEWYLPGDMITVGPTEYIIKDYGVPFGSEFLYRIIENR